MPEAWTYNKRLALVEDENGLPVCTRVSDDEDGELIASAPTLAKQVELLREALEELLDPPQGTDIRDRIAKGRFALEATKEGV